MGLATYIGVDSTTITEYYFPAEFIELPDGNFISPSYYYIRETAAEYYSEAAAAMMFSENGDLIAQNNFFRPGYCTSFSEQFVFKKDNSFYFLTTYSPEHTINSFNYFKNYDNPPTDAKLALFKLDSQLNVEETYEHSWPIDTFEARNRPEWQLLPNGYSGNIFLFSAFEDEGNIVGAYWKSESFKSPGQGKDTLFMFRMNFDGEILLRKDIDYASPSKSDVIKRGAQAYSNRRNQFIVTDTHYIFYSGGKGNYDGYDIQGRAVYYDKDFNFIRERYLRGPDCLINDKLYNISVKRSNHNTTYLTTQKRNPKNPQHDEDCRLYEIDDDINAASEFLEVVNHTDRGTEEWDMSSYRAGVDLNDDNSIYYTYTLNQGYFTNLDSWIVIERLDDNMDIISTYYYGLNNRFLDRVITLYSTDDGGVIIIHRADDLYSDNTYGYITKFPASAFVNIEEAHAHGLKVAVAYPNPGGDVMNIRTGLRNAVLTVYDMQGRKVHQQIITDEVTSIDASKWQNGTYVWELRAGNGNGSGNENGILESGKWVK